MSNANDNAAGHAQDDDGCMCEWPADCGGMGTMSCEGCGGDLCVCVCGGETECFGCDMCGGDDLDDWPNEADARTEGTEKDVRESAARNA